MRLIHPVNRVRMTLAVAGVMILLCAAGAWSQATTSASSTMSPHNRHHESWNREACATCHSSHTAESRNLLKSENLFFSVCLACHNGTWPSPFPGDVHNPEKMHSFGAESELGCNGCHQMHPPYRFEKLLRRQYTAESLQENINQSQNTSDYLLCLDCHNSYQAKGAPDIARYYLGGTGHYIRTQGGTFSPGWQLSCANCHDVHGSDNSKNIRNTLTVQIGPGQNAGSADFPIQYSSNAHIREFCLTCHTTDRYVYGIPLQLSTTISEHSTGTESCTECHGHVPGMDSKKRTQKGVHAPIVPPPTVNFNTSELTHEGSNYFRIDFHVFHDGSHLASKKNTPFVNRNVVFQVLSGAGTLQTLTGTVDNPLFAPISSPHSTTSDVNGIVTVWVQVPPGTTIIRVVTGTITRDISLVVAPSISGGDESTTEASPTIEGPTKADEPGNTEESALISDDSSNH